MLAKYYRLLDILLLATGISNVHQFLVYLTILSTKPKKMTLKMEIENMNLKKVLRLYP